LSFLIVDILSFVLFWYWAKDHKHQVTCMQTLLIYLQDQTFYSP